MGDILQGIIFFILLPCFSALAVLEHPCNRRCKENESRTCEYNFTVENYFVLSRACYGCPFNYTDCYRPHCVSTNGMYRHILTVNRQLPGPSIEVCMGDSVRVWVHNMIDDGSATTIHWHGLKQTNSNPMDGVPRLTQCDILPSETFKYEFVADNAGTHWWHSHAGVQLGDGLFGAFIVRQPLSADPSSYLYENDLSQHVMLITDWPEQPQIFRYMEEMQHRWVTPKMVKVLVNGRGRKYNVTDPVNATGYGGGGIHGYTPYEVFTVNSGERYRFRVIAAATRCYFRVMVDNHEIIVITSDGWPIRPATVLSFLIHPGERYDFILNATQLAGDYWIKVESYGDCKASDNDGHGAAILHYNGHKGAPDYNPGGNVENFTSSGVILNPDTELKISNINATMIYQGELRFDPPSGVDEDYTNEVVDVKYYASLRYQTNDNNYYSHPEYYPNPVRWGLLTPTINNLTMYRPSAPLATQWDIAEKRFCNSSTVATATDCNDNMCLCTHMLDVKKGQVVELFLASAAADPHQMHLHGHTFRVVGEGYLVDPKTTDYLTLGLDTIKKRDADGEYPRILTNPWYKDTVTVQGMGGFVIIRFKADNPGIWFVHCHNEGHLMQGMAMIIKVGDPSEFPRAPTYHPTCGGYSYYLSERTKCAAPTNVTGGTIGYSADIFVVVVMITIHTIVSQGS